MSLHASRAKLSDGSKKLMVTWDMVRRTWDDAAARDFEKKFLVPMEPRIRATLSAMEQMAEVIGRARRDCGDD